MAKRHTSDLQLVSQVRRCQELIVARSGADDFYEVIRLLVAKSFHERSSTSKPLNYETACSHLQANAEVLGRFIDGSVHFTTPPEVINECFDVLAATCLHAVGFEGLDAAFEVLTAKDYKSDKGQYFTPRHVVSFCIDVLRPTSGEMICDPACGSGAFLYSAFSYLKGRVRPNQLFGFDISTRAVKTAGLMSFLACKDSLRIAQADSLDLGFPSIVYKARYDTIESAMSQWVKQFRGFDVIATNPPFAGDIGASEYSLSYEVANLGGRKVERDVLFLERCHKLLSPGGRLAIVVPDNKVSANRFSPLRQWLLERFNVVSVVSLHANTFRPHTTQKAAVIFASKPHRTELKTSRSIILYRSDKPGKTSTGDTVFANGRVDHDLDVISRDLEEIQWAA